MKRLEYRIREASKTRGVLQTVIERDYAQSFVLKSLATIDGLIFKGGTALKKVYFGDYRFSEDLDFSATHAPTGNALDQLIFQAIEQAQKDAQRFSPITFVAIRYEEKKPHPGGQDAYKVTAQFPWQRQPQVPILIEITHDEKLELPIRFCPILHNFEEPFAANIATYCLEEICAEKLRSSRQTLAQLKTRSWLRPRGRDFYDLWKLTKVNNIDWQCVSRILPVKCSDKNVSISSVDDIFDPRLIAEVRKSWNQALGPFLPQLPNVDGVLAETYAALNRLLTFRN
jgi:uncharacterized protein